MRLARLKSVLLGLLVVELVSVGGFILHAKTLTVLALTDLHGALESGVNLTKDKQEVKFGGAAYIATYMKRIQEKVQGPVLIVDAGDAFQGTMESNHFEGRPVVEFYNYIGMGALAIGNHEFDYGPEGPKAVPTSPGDDPQGALKNMIGWARFPFLSANLFLKDYGKKRVRPDWLEPSTLIDFDGVKIGVIGASAHSSLGSTNSKNVENLIVDSPMKWVEIEAKKLRAAGAEALILIFHEGGGCRDNSPTAQHDLSSCDNDSGLFSEVAKLKGKTVDLVIGGHSHKGVLKMLGGIGVVQPYAKGSHIGWAEIKLPTIEETSKTVLKDLLPVCVDVVLLPSGPSCRGVDVRSYEGQVYPAHFLGAEVTADLGVEELLKPYFAQIEAVKLSPLAVTVARDFSRSYNGENAMGNLLTDLLQEYLATDVAVNNNGGFRDDFKSGELRYVDVFNVQPFDNVAAVISVDDKMLKRMVQLSINEDKFSWSGLTFVSRNKVLIDLKVQGKALVPGKTYTVGTNDYMAAGGSGFSSLNIPPAKIKVLDDAPYLRDITVEMLEKIGRPLDPSQYFDPGNRRQQ